MVDNVRWISDSFVHAKAGRYIFGYTPEELIIDLKLMFVQTFMAVLRKTVSPSI